MHKVCIHVHMCACGSYSLGQLIVIKLYSMYGVSGLCVVEVLCEVCVCVCLSSSPILLN